MQIREIKKSDNPEIAKVIRDVFIELDAPKVGTAYADPILDTLFEVYQNSKSKYFVVEKNGRVLGGGGIGPLENGPILFASCKKCILLPRLEV